MNEPEQSLRLQRITPAFIDKVLTLFPHIKCIAHNDEIALGQPDDIFYMISSDSSGVHVYFFNLTDKEILSLIDEKFAQSSENLAYYFSLLALSNKILSNQDDFRFHTSVNLIDNYNDSTENTFKFKAIRQINTTPLLIFNYQMTLVDKIGIEVEEDDGTIIYTVNLTNSKFYDAYREVIIDRLNKYIDVNELRLFNIQEHANLIQMLKI